MKPFQEIGGVIARRWRSANFDEATFPSIATSALQEFALAERLRASDVVDWLFHSPNLPRQPDPESKFGQPPLTLFRDQGFFIDVLFWLTGSTTIHQHGFSGAFAMLEGESVHTEYRFDPTHAVNATLTGGTMALRQSELLVRGDIRPIVAGAPFIHATFHVGKPTVTIVVRTAYEPVHAPQYDYLWPSVRKVVERWNECLVRQLELLRFLAKSGSPDAVPLALRLLDGADAYSTFSVVDLCLTLFTAAEDRERIVAVAKKQHAALVEDVLFPALHEINRQKELLAVLKKSDDEAERLVLALLLTVPNRAHFARLVSARFGAVAVDRVAAALERVIDKGLAPAAARWLLGARALADDGAPLARAQALRPLSPFVREQ